MRFDMMDYKSMATLMETNLEKLNDSTLDSDSDGRDVLQD
jgi:hypothetical protein